MIRVTLKDPAQTISFLTGEEIARRIVAACSANPDAIDELLLAAEVFQQGISVALMESLMQFDQALLREGPQGAHQLLEEPAADSSHLQRAFEVVDDRTAALAFDAHKAPILIIDLAARSIQASDDLTVRASGEVLAHSGSELTERAITYVLPKEWTIRSLKKS